MGESDSLPIIHTDWSSFNEELIEAFPDSITRPAIFRNFSLYIHRLASLIGTEFYQWIDGSCVTQNLNPRDMDFVTFVGANIFSKMSLLSHSCKITVSTNAWAWMDIEQYEQLLFSRLKRRLKHLHCQFPRWSRPISIYQFLKDQSY